MISAEFLVKKVVKDELLSSLSNISDYYLSSDSVISSIDSRFFEKAAQLKQEKGVVLAGR